MFCYMNQIMKSYCKTIKFGNNEGVFFCTILRQKAYRQASLYNSPYSLKKSIRTQIRTVKDAVNNRLLIIYNITNYLMHIYNMYY